MWMNICSFSLVLDKIKVSWTISRSSDLYSLSFDLQKTTEGGFCLWAQGVLLGMSNTAGVLAGVFGTAATGYILQNG